MAAKDARYEILGVRFNPALESVDGSPLSMEQFEGRVVLVPFWAAAFPESLQLLGLLEEIRKANPDDVAIVGVNLDGDDALLQEFLDQSELGFPSFRSKSSAEAEVANPIAAQFGIASMPFLAIIDRQGKVAALNFTGQGIQEKVEELLARK
jgi:thioredoxin-like negative regulator of GroEL